MRFLNPYIFSLLVIGLTISSCTSDNECDTVCPAGTFQLIDCTCIDEFDPNDSIESIDIQGEISSDQTWTTGNIYILNDRVTVVNGATLTIEPGVIVKGVGGTGADASALVIARGSQINALGTADNPIVFTSTADGIEPGENVGTLNPDINGLWGGLIVLGLSLIHI